MRKYSYTLILVLSVLFVSCRSLESISIDYLQSAEISFPKEIRKVAVVNNTVDNTDRNEITGKQVNGQNPLYNLQIDVHGDGQVAAETLAESIAAQNYFDAVIICDSALRAKDNFPREAVLSPDEVKQLSGDLGADLVISVEDVQIHAKRMIEYLSDWNCYRGTLDVKVRPVIRVYLPGRQSPMVTVAPQDSIFWEQFGTTERYVRNALLPEQKMVREASDFAGSIPVKQLLPVWETGQRFFYAGGNVEMRDAAVAVRENSWDDALKLWEKMNKAKGDKKQFYSSVNIALYYEMHDQLDKAMEYLKKAESIALEKYNKKHKDAKVQSLDEIKGVELDADNALIIYYKKELEKRLGDLQRLNLQMNIFNGDF